MKRRGTWHWRRVALNVVALVLLGSLSTVLTAAGFAYVPDDREHRDFGRTNLSISLGSTRYSTRASFPNGPGEFAALTRRILHTCSKPPRPPQDPSMRVSYAPISDESFVIGEHWGIPFRAIEGWRAVRPKGETLLMGDLTLLFVKDRGRELLFNHRRVVPIKPLYTGFLINTLIYTSFWVSVLYMPGLARRSLRRRRGLCPACTYDLRATPPGSPCPECGATRPNR